MVSQNSLNNQVLNNDFMVTHTNSGGNAFVSVANLSNTASSNALFKATVAGASGGNPFVNLNISGGQNWSLGLNIGDSNAFVLSASSALGTTNVIRAAVGGNVSVVLGNFDVTRSASGSTVSGTVSNTSNTASSNATQFITVAGSSAGDAAVQYAVNGVTTWTEGIDNSDGDAYALAISNALGTTNAFHITTAGAPTFPISPLDVPSGGTTKTSFTAYSVLCGGTTSTGALQNVVGVGTSGQFLTSSGAGALPTWTSGGGTGTLSTLTGNTGGAISPTAGNINILGAGSITIAGSGSTLTTQLTGLTNHDVLIGQGTTTIGLVAPGTAGVPLVSNGAAADPSFSTALVVGGGTGLTSMVAYAVLTGGTTTTGNVQQVSGLGNSGQVLTSNGAAALPTWQSNANLNITTVAIKTFTSSGTYTPSITMRYCIVEIVGGGGGGGANGFTFAIGSSAGGGGGGYSRKVFSSTDVGASQSVTIGAGGAGGVPNGTGGTGGNTTFGALLTSTGGAGGNPSVSALVPSLGGLAGVGDAGANVAINGQIGTAGFTYASGGLSFGISGKGGDSFFGGGADASIAISGGVTDNAPGVSAVAYGSGGSGSAVSSVSANQSGGAGKAGVCIITEFIST